MVLFQSRRVLRPRESRPDHRPSLLAFSFSFFRFEFSAPRQHRESFFRNVSGCREKAAGNRLCSPIQIIFTDRRLVPADYLRLAQFYLFEALGINSLLHPPSGLWVSAADFWVKFVDETFLEFLLVFFPFEPIVMQMSLILENAVPGVVDEFVVLAVIGNRLYEVPGEEGEGVVLDTFLVGLADRIGPRQMRVLDDELLNFKVGTVECGIELMPFLAAVFPEGPGDATRKDDGADRDDDVRNRENGSIPGCYPLHASSMSGC
jgi:hypothetical protein